MSSRVPTSFASKRWGWKKDLNGYGPSEGPLPDGHLAQKPQQHINNINSRGRDCSLFVGTPTTLLVQPVTADPPMEIDVGGPSIATQAQQQATVAYEKANRLPIPRFLDAVSSRDALKTLIEWP